MTNNGTGPKLYHMSETNNATETTATALETETCSRCGGGGQYSYCQMYGTKCFKCGGKGRSLTKRGAAAAKYLTALRSKRIADLVPGDVVWIDNFFTAAWVTLDTVEPYEQFGCSGSEPTRRYEGLSYSGVTKDGKAMGSNALDLEKLVRVSQSKEQRAATMAQALAYQATLTKAGTPRKVKP